MLWSGSPSPSVLAALMLGALGNAQSYSDPDVRSSAAAKLTQRSPLRSIGPPGSGAPESRPQRQGRPISLRVSMPDQASGLLLITQLSEVNWKRREAEVRQAHDRIRTASRLDYASENQLAPAPPRCRVLYMFAAAKASIQYKGPKRLGCCTQRLQLG